MPVPPKSRLSSRIQSIGSKTPPHVVITARAGTGKTTTLVEVIKDLKGIQPSITPSPQQEAIWEQIRLSRGARFMCMLAFNKSIVKDISRRVPAGVDSKTLHQHGNYAVGKYFRLHPDRDKRYNGNKVLRLIPEFLKKNVDDIPNIILQGTNKLVGLCKMNLLEPTEENLVDLATRHEIELNGSFDIIHDLVIKILDRCKNNVNNDRCIDFNDMIWLPVVHNIPIFKYEVLFCDEAQDFSRCEQELIFKSGKRIIICGDPKQAIYAFKGADSRSMERMKDILGNTPQGVVELPLTVTRRCGHAIVKEANKYVEDFYAHESNPPGRVMVAKLTGNKPPVFPIGLTSEETERDYLPGHNPKTWSYRYSVKDGDMILCRTTAPLVTECFWFIKEGRKANIQGRNIGQNLIRLIQKFRAESLDDLEEKTESWYDKEVEKENKKDFPDEGYLISLQDRRDCIFAFMQGAETVEDVINNIEEMFSDDSIEGIRLSSGHKSKGLESDRVFILDTVPFPHPMAKSDEAVEQEYNLRYVMITRAIKELVYVKDRL